MQMLLKDNHTSCSKTTCSAFWNRRCVHFLIWSFFFCCTRLKNLKDIQETCLSTLRNITFQGNESHMTSILVHNLKNLSVATIFRRKNLYYHRQKKNVPSPSCSHLGVSASRLPTLARHQPITSSPITCLIPSKGRQPQRIDVQVVAGGDVFSVYDSTTAVLLIDRQHLGWLLKICIKKNNVKNKCNQSRIIST